MILSGVDGATLLCDNIGAWQVTRKKSSGIQAIELRYAVQLLAQQMTDLGGFFEIVTESVEGGEAVHAVNRLTFP